MFGFYLALDVPVNQAAYFYQRLLVILLSCEERWNTEFDEISWAEFTHAQEVGGNYEKFMVGGISHLLQALRVRYTPSCVLYVILIKCTA